MTNVSKLRKEDAEVADSLNERGHSDDSIRSMSPDDAFDEYCNWHGLIGWGPQLRDALDLLRKCQIKHLKDRTK